jgi:nitroreductase
MWRTFLDRPIDGAVLDRVLQAGHHAPSAGFTQGFAFVVLVGSEETERFWDAAPPPPGTPPYPPGMRRAPVLILPLASKQAYLDRYAEGDKGWTDRDESRWPVPYWYVDASFASMLMLLAAVDEGLGAVFFGVSPPNVLPLRKALGIPGEWDPIGAIAIGHRDHDPVVGSAAARPRMPIEYVVHRARW